jgi:hypothetical protein
MMLFLIFLIPVCLAIILINFNRSGQTIILPVIPFFQGMFLFLPSFILSAVISGLMEPSYSTAGFFFYTFFHEHFIMLLLCFGWVVLLRNSLLLNPKENILYSIMAFFGGYYSMVNIHLFFSRITHLDAYTLFLLPVVNLSLVVLCAFFLTHLVREYGFLRYASLLSLIALPLLVTVFSILFLRHFPLPAAVATLCFGILAFALFFARKDTVA